VFSLSNQFCRMVAKADAVRYPNRDEGELGAILKSLSPAERAL
jgi:hypothetical protein